MAENRLRAVLRAAEPELFDAAVARDLVYVSVIDEKGRDITEQGPQQVYLRLEEGGTHLKVHMTEERWYRIKRKAKSFRVAVAWTAKGEPFYRCNPRNIPVGPRDCITLKTEILDVFRD